MTNYEEVKQKIQKHILEKDKITIEELNVILDKYDLRDADVDKIFYEFSSHINYGDTKTEDLENEDFTMLMSQEELKFFLDENNANKKRGIVNDGMKFYSDIVNKYRLLTEEEENELLPLCATNEKALELMWCSNLRLVYSVAKKYTNRGLPLLDLLSEGGIGLSKAIKKYRPGHGTRFATYATYWIRHSITRAIDNYGRNIRIPVNTVQQINKIKVMQSKLTSELGEEPTIEEIAARVKMTPKKVEKLLPYLNDTISFDNNFEINSNEKDVMGFEELLSGDNNMNVSDDVNHILLQDAIEKIVTDLLTEREAFVLLHRMGLCGKQQLTLEEIGARYNVTPERIRQIERDAIGKLAVSGALEDFKDYLN